ncbi:MAG: glutamine--scyllo-inositol aminotransferase, partial [Fuerstiella sp.]|nr:glutamine--scyllo-inositol aminotransferase [Fuerstiella sp.]
SNIQAAIGCGQMERIEELTARKREILGYYREQLLPLRGLAMNTEPEGTVNGAWMPTVVFDVETGVTREKLLSAFAEEDADARVFFPPLSSLDCFDNVTSNPLAREIPNRGINLPSFHDMSDDEQHRVVNVVRRCLA